MIVTMLKSKLHRAKVTESNLEYEGSVAIDKNLLDAVGLIPYEKVEIYNITNGERFNTYVIEAEAGSGAIGIQGAAAHKASVGDRVIICAYANMGIGATSEFKPRKALLNENNEVMNG